MVEKIKTRLKAAREDLDADPKDLPEVPHISTNGVSV